MLTNSLFSAQMKHNFTPCFLQKTPAASPYHMTICSFNINEIQVSPTVKMHTSM